MKTTSLLLALCLLTFACNDTQDKENTSAKSPTDTDSVENDKPMSTNKAMVAGVYATNTSPRIKVYHAINLVDGDTTTYWRTPVGAGLDEGVTIQFEHPTYIKSVQCYQPKGAYGKKIKGFEVYADGVFHTDQQHINKKISTLYIRLSDLEGTTSTESTIGESTVKRKSFDAGSYVAIGEVILTGKDDKPIEYITPKLISAKITASTSLKPVQAYGASNLFDCKKDFGWAEGAKGKGVGEKININLQVPAKPSILKIWNGYQRSDEHYKSNARLKSFEFGPEGGPYTTYNVADTKEPITVTLSGIEEGHKFELIAKEVYPGTKYEDLVISELKLYEANIPLLILPQSLDDVVEQNLENANNLFKRYLDKNINVSYAVDGASEGDVINFQSGKNSIIIRSNNSFVLYQSSNEDTESYGSFSQSSNETIAEGNWELVNQTEEAVKIRIFGKIYQVSSESELYKGDKTSESTKIFQDELTITAKGIEGKKFVKKIVLP